MYSGLVLALFSLPLVVGLCLESALFVAGLELFELATPVVAGVPRLELSVAAAGAALLLPPVEVEPEVIGASLLLLLLTPPPPPVVTLVSLIEELRSFLP